ncbi:MAG: hypothetical protein AB4426_01570 [Xenococcaceae cyanobacterium]
MTNYHLCVLRNFGAIATRCAQRHLLTQMTFDFPVGAAIAKIKRAIISRGKS